MPELTEHFWTYTKNNMKVASLEDAFTDWVNDHNLDIDVAKKAWDTINLEVKTALGDAGSPGSMDRPTAGGKGTISGGDAIDSAGQDVAGMDDTSRDALTGLPVDGILHDLVKTELKSKEEELLEA